jgi:hypothetical protein
MPEASNRFSFKPLHVSAQYKEWPRLVDLCAEQPITGYKENRGFCMIADVRAELVSRMKKYFDKNIPWDELKKIEPIITKDAARYNAKDTHEKLLNKTSFNDTSIIRYLLRPFESKYAYFKTERPLWNEPRPALKQHQFKGNSFLVSRPAAVTEPEGTPFFFHTYHADFHSMRGQAHHFPLLLNKYTKHATKRHALRQSKEKFQANIGVAGQEYLCRMGFKETPSLPAQDALWLHVLAIGYSPAYLMENADGIRSDWPRIPLPPDKESLKASAALGRRIAALLDVDTPVSDVTHGQINPVFRLVGSITAVDSDSVLDPEKGHLELTAGWGHAGKDGVTMPGKGKLVERVYSPKEMEAITQGAQVLGLTQGEVFARLGATTYDIYLNNAAFWRNVPKTVWEYYIGGYQVIKKWLSYRESVLLGRSLAIEEARYVTDVARRLTSLRLMEKALDENYRVITQAT